MAAAYRQSFSSVMSRSVFWTHLIMSIFILWNWTMVLGFRSFCFSLTHTKRNHRVDKSVLLFSPIQRFARRCSHPLTQLALLQNLIIEQQATCSSQTKRNFFNCFSSAAMISLVKHGRDYFRILMYDFASRQIHPRRIMYKLV